MDAFAGGRVVKGFDHLVAAVLDQNPAVQGGRRVVFLSSDDDDAAAQVGALAEYLTPRRSRLTDFRKVGCSFRRTTRAGAG